MADGINVSWRMDKGQFTIGSRGCLRHSNGRKFVDQAIPQQPVLGHGKPVPRRQR